MSARESALVARTFVVVVNYDGGEGNLACLESVFASGVPAGRVVFVDNASSDGSREAVHARWPELVTIDNDRNLGFGAAANQGVDAACARGAGAVLLLNNDATLEPDCLARLCACLDDDPTIGVCGPLVLLGRDGERVWAAGGRMTWRQNLSELVGHRRPCTDELRQDRDVDYVPGCAMLVRREVFDAVGALDAALFAYHEDVDLCLRAREAGLRTRFVGGAVARHDAHGATGGGYNPRRKYMMGMNAVWFLRRYGSPMRWLGFALFDVAPVPLLVVLGLFTGRWRGALAKGLGQWHGLRGRRVRAEYLRPGASRLW